jgi:WD40 repeat protein
MTNDQATDNEVRLWDVHTVEERFGSMKVGERLDSIAISPNDDVLATGGFGGIVSSVRPRRRSRLKENDGSMLQSSR